MMLKVLRGVHSFSLRGVQEAVRVLGQVLEGHCSLLDYSIFK